MIAHPAVQPHRPLEKLVDDVYWVQGSIRMGPGMRINRNMVVVRQPREVIILNPVRVDEATEAEIEGLGPVNHILRLGYFHGMDDGHYVERFGASLWCQAGSDRYDEPLPDLIMGERTELPIEGARLFVFRKANHPECAVLIPQGGGLLVTCDSVQHHLGTPMCSLLAKVAMRAMGFVKPMNIGPPWLKENTPEGGSLRPDFERLLQLDFDRAVGAHGTACHGGAKEALRATVARVFG